MKTLLCAQMRYQIIVLGMLCIALQVNGQSFLSEETSSGYAYAGHEGVFSSTFEKDEPILPLSITPTEITGSFTQGNVFVQDTLNIGLQNGAAGYRLSVDGKIMCEELKIQNSGAWPDYVFNENYPLLRLNILEDFIRDNKHLPGIPSAAEIDQHGIEVGDLQKALLEKVEELTLYIIQQDKRIAELESNVNSGDRKKSSKRTAER